VQVLLLEPDRWRYVGLSQVLESEPGVRFLGSEDHTRILALKDPPTDLKPDVVIVSHSLLMDFRLSILDHLRMLFPKSSLLVDGYDRTLNSIAEILRAGASGYFLLTSEPFKLLEALTIVEQGHIWAPRDAVALMARNASTNQGQGDLGAEIITPTELAILRLLEQGFSNKEIAQKLDIAAVTVKSHLTKLYRRFEIKTRLELLAYAVSHHLMTDQTTTSLSPRR
jgi:DNA-binding NarL/FixJ family response regulator